MKAVLFDRYGPADVLAIADVEPPQPKPGQVRVQVRAVGIQPFDVGVRLGSMPIPVDFPQRLGNEFAGVVETTGDGVTGWRAGDEVIGFAFMRSLAQYVVVDQEVLVRKPATMPWDVAGGLSSSGQTAYWALRELGVTRGETVLIHAAAGGVGTVAVQLARAWAADVIGTASAANHDYVASLGASPVAYGSGLVDRVRALAPGGVDVALDAVGGQALRDSLNLVADRSRIGTLVDHDSADALGVRGIRAQLSADQLRALVALHEAGDLRLTIRATFPLERIADAHREVERGHGRGKVVVRVT